MKLPAKLKSARILSVSLFCIVYIIYLTFTLNHLTKFITVDESIWWIYDRVPKYWNSLREGNINGTFINDKPGISVALVSGIGYNLTRENFSEGIIAHFAHPNAYKRIESQDLKLEENLLALRLPLIIFNGIFALFLFWLIRKITDDFLISFWFFVFTLLSPILLGIAQIINPDTLLWPFSAGALLSFIAFLKFEEKRFAVFSSLCLGLALLSKYTATIFYPFLIISSFVFLASQWEIWQEKSQNFSKKLRIIFLGTLAIIAGSVIVFALGMPAVFVRPLLLWQGTVDFPGMRFFLWPLIGLQIILVAEAFFFKSKFSGILFKYTGIFLKKYGRFIYLLLLIAFIFTLANWLTDFRFFSFKDLRFDLGKADKFVKLPILWKFIFEIRPLVFSLTPIVLFLLFFSWLKLFWKKSFDFLPFILSLFFIVFYAAVIFEGLLITIRYSIILYPLASIIAALGLSELCRLKAFSKIKPAIVSVLIILISFISLWFIQPFYFNYTNFLLPKNSLVTGAWGYGGYEAAQYFNSMPEAENLVIWSDYSGVCEFTKGKCYITTRIPNKDVDYFVLTRRGHINYPKRNDKVLASPYYDDTNPVWQMIIDGRPGNYIKIFKNNTKQP